MSLYSVGWDQFTDTNYILVEFCGLKTLKINYSCISGTFLDVKVILRNRRKQDRWKLPLDSRWYKGIPKIQLFCDTEPYFGREKWDSVVSFATDILYDLGHCARGT